MAAGKRAPARRLRASAGVLSTLMTSILVAASTAYPQIVAADR
jgi:hypothetical protein